MENTNTNNTNTNNTNEKKVYINPVNPNRVIPVKDLFSASDWKVKTYDAYIAYCNMIKVNTLESEVAFLRTVSALGVNFPTIEQYDEKLVIPAMEGYKFLHTLDGKLLTIKLNTNEKKVASVSVFRHIASDGFAKLMGLDVKIPEAKKPKEGKKEEILDPIVANVLYKGMKAVIPFTVSQLAILTEDRNYCINAVDNITYIDGRIVTYNPDGTTNESKAA